MRISMNEYPGKIAHLLSTKKKLHENANAVMLETLDESSLELAEHFRQSKVKIGVKTSDKNTDILRTLISKELVDFIALEIEKPEKKAVGFVRASGVDYEIRILADKMSVREVEKVYNGVLPCKHFVIMSREPNKFSEFLKDKENAVVRFSGE